MFDKAIEVMKLIESNGFKIYIVGGYVRDIYLSIVSTDIDMCTNAKPKDLVKIFKKNITIDEKYGSVKLEYKNCLFDITTFRKDIKYKDNRRPSEIEYVDDLKEDLNRRDFTINTMCMDSDGNIIDILNAKKDIEKKLIRTVRDPKKTLEEDALRILRAIRFSCTLDFRIDWKLEFFIRKYSKLLDNISFDRKKSELNNIFKSDNYEKGLKLISKYRLDKYLGISKYNKIKKTSDLLGMWAQIDYSDSYAFTKLEKETIKKIRELLIYGKIDLFALYKYGNYIASIVSEILDIDKKEISEMYESLPIYSKEDIKLNIMDICSILNVSPSNKTKDILNDIEYKIINGELKNTKKDIEKYIKESSGD